MFNGLLKKVVAGLMVMAVIIGSSAVPYSFAAKASTSFKGVSDVKGILFAPSSESMALRSYLGALAITDKSVDYVTRMTATEQLTAEKAVKKAKLTISSDKKLITVSFKDDSKETQYYYFKKDSKGNLLVAYATNPKKPSAYVSATLFKDVKSATAWMIKQSSFKTVLEEEIAVESVGGDGYQGEFEGEGAAEGQAGESGN